MQTAVDSWDPSYGSGSEVFVVGIGILAVGLLLLIGAHRRHPGYFSGASLPRSAPQR